MAQIFPIGTKLRCLPAQNGNILVAGSTSDENPSGAVRFWFVPSIDAVGSFTVVGRAPRISTGDDSAPWIPIPYRRVTLDNVASDYGIVTADVSGTSSILVPTTGGQVGLLVNQSAGEIQVFCNWVEGSTVP